MTHKINHPLYLSIRLALKHIIRIIFKFKGYRIVNRHLLPKKRCGCMLISNHAAFIDSVYIISALKPRFTICGAKPKYFENPVRREVFRIANILKVDNKDQFIRDCTKLLNKNENILIYPEMGRNYSEMGDFKTWAAEVAIEAQVETIPLYLYGTTEKQSGDVKLIVGDSIPATGTQDQLTQVYRDSVLQLKP